MAGKLGFLGPRGTFTEEAALSTMGVGEADMVPYSTEAEVILAAERDEVDRGIVPIENSIEGGVNATMDVLTFETHDLRIEREIVAPVRHHLLARPGVAMADVREIVSHPQATAQCRRYLAEKLPGVQVRAAYSTADAAQQVAEADGGRAAIGTALAGRLYGLETLDQDIEDYEDNKTRFVVVGKDRPAPTGHDKTSLVCFIYEDRPGSLLMILQEFAFRYINLTKIQSRPTKKALGDYCFWIDFEGHADDETAADALKCLQCKLREVKVLGSYPMADDSGDGPGGDPAAGGRPC